MGEIDAPQLRQRAKELRRQATPAEARLWEALRGSQLDARFRRQHPVETFVLDFYCPRYRLAIEVDGGIHTQRDVIDHDAARTAWLNANGCRLIRFTNEEVLHDLPSVVARITACLDSIPL